MTSDGGLSKLKKYAQENTNFRHFLWKKRRKLRAKLFKNVSC